jgi:archaeal flagellar protein FlaJ
MRTLYDMTPQRYKNFFKSQIMYAGFREYSSNRIVGISFFISIFAIVASLIVTLLLGVMPIGIFISLAAGGGVMILTYIIFMFIADSRANQVENVLPDALQLMSANVRAGMTIDRAIWLSARPEFGILEDEIKMVGSKTMGGKTLKNALTEMTKSVRSSLLDRTVKLLLEGIDSGGELAHLLEEIASNVRTTQTLKKEIKSSVMTYSLFILFAAVIAAPFLYSISIFFVDTMTNLWGSAGIGSQAAASSAAGLGGIFQKAKGPQVSSSDLLWFSITSLIVTGFFGSLTISLIQSGKEKNGLKMVPILVAASIAILLISNMMVKMLFKSFFTL